MSSLWLEVRKNDFIKRGFPNGIPRCVLGPATSLNRVDEKNHSLGVYTNCKMLNRNVTASAFGKNSPKNCPLRPITAD